MFLIHKVPHKIIGNTIHFNIKFNNPLDKSLLVAFVYPNVLFINSLGFNCRNPNVSIKILRKNNLFGIELENLLLSQDFVFLSLSINIRTCVPVPKNQSTPKNNSLDLTKNMNIVVLNDDFNKHHFLTKI